MTNLIAFILERILLGTVDAASSKRMTMIIRILLGLALLSAFLGLFGLILHVGIQSGNIALCAVAFLVLLSAAIIIFSKIKQIRGR